MLSNKLESMLKIVLWVIPIIFAGGVWYSTMESTKADVVRNEKSIKDLSKDVTLHDKQDAHPVTKTKLNQIQKEVEDIRIEQRVMRVEQTKSSINLSAICQATGANCQ